MGPDTVVHLSDTDIEIIDILSDVGLKSGEARVLVVLFKGYDLTSREVERISDLRQPEVSIAINQLIKRSWVYVTSHITEKKVVRSRFTVFSVLLMRSLIRSQNFTKFVGLPLCWFLIAWKM